MFTNVWPHEGFLQYHKGVRDGVAIVLGSSTHFELMARHGRRWTVIDVLNDRNTAMKTAEKLWASKQYEGVRLVKETFDKETGNFSSIELLKRGGFEGKKPREVVTEVTPCLTPNELYSADGRRSVWDLLHNTLADWSVTPTELLHNLDHYYKLYNTGLKLEDAIQRTVVTFDDDEESIQVRMRRLRKVVDACVDILKAEQDNIPVLEEGRLKPLIAALQDKTNRNFLLTASIANYLKDIHSVEDKLGRLVVFVSKSRPLWVLEILDQIISELLLIDRLLRILSADDEDHIVFLTVLTHVAGGSLGRLDAQSYYKALAPELKQLDEFVEQGLLPETRRVLKIRLEKEILASKSLTDGGVSAQVKALAGLRDDVLSQQFEESSLDSLEEAIKVRESRLVNTQSIGDKLNEISDPLDQVQYLIDLINACTGETNKRTAANCILPVMSNPRAEAVFMGLSGKPLARMPEIVELQRQVLTSDMTEMFKRKISEKLDMFCRAVLDSTDLMRKIHHMNISSQEKAMKLLHMLADDYFTDGDARSRVEAQALIYMRQTDFTDQLLAAQPDDKPEQVLLEFRDLLESAGLSKRHENQQKELAVEEELEGSEPADNESGAPPETIDLPKAAEG